MKLEFRPDFRISPQLKIIWPKIRELFGGFKFKPENYRQMMKKVLTVLSWVFLLLIVLFIAIWVL
jgi:hypothetical protein